MKAVVPVVGKEWPSLFSSKAVTQQVCVGGGGGEGGGPEKAAAPSLVQELPCV